MNTILFAVEAKKLFFVKKDRKKLAAGPRKRRYQHSFGGPPRHEGVIPPGFEHPVHLLYLFDLKDPKIGLQLPGLRWLPIYYGRRAGGISYCIVSNSRIEILSNPYSDYDREHGTFDDFPPPFPQVPVSLQASEYDPHDPSDVVAFGKIFGVDELTPEEKAWVQSRIEEDCRQEHGFELTDWGGEPFQTLEDVVDWFAGGWYYPQGFLKGRCPNPKCKNHDQEGKWHGLLVLEPEKKDKPLYQEIESIDAGERLVYEICTECRTVCGSVPVT
jgi:hypothetical protein